MNIVLATDHNFVVHCATTIMSIVSNNDAANFYILTDGLSVEDVNRLNRVAATNGSTLYIVEIPSHTFDGFPMPANEATSHISIATYYRLYVPKLLPETLDKVIYLDCDIIVRKSLKDLYDVNIDHSPLAAVYQIASWNVERTQALSIPMAYGYFNAGVLLINVKYWREHDCLSVFLDFIRNNHDKIKYHDQDVLNAVFYKNTVRLSCMWNMLTSYFRKSIHAVNEYDKDGKIIRSHDDYKSIICQEVKDPHIIHFVSRPKPWVRGCKHPWLNEYIKYSKMAGYNFKLTMSDRFMFYFMSFMNHLDLSPWFKIYK